MGPASPNNARQAGAVRWEPLKRGRVGFFAVFVSLAVQSRKKLSRGRLRDQRQADAASLLAARRKRLRQKMTTLVILACLTPLWSQQRMGTLTGVILDPSGGRVPLATVQAKNLETGTIRAATSNHAGEFRFAQLEPGRYSVLVMQEGFTAVEVTDIQVQLDRETQLEVHLQLSPLPQQVEVQAIGSPIEFRSGTATSFVDFQSVNELPLNGRDFLQLALLAPDVTLARSQVRNVNTGYGLQLSISGGRPSQNAWYVDGVSVAAYHGTTPSSALGLNLGVEALREFSVHTSGYGAELGRAGAGVVNVVTRAGTNSLRGTASFFHRNDNWDARNFFDRSKPEFRRHQFGGSVGGPLRRDRTFFFTAYEGIRQLQGQTTINTTLSPSARQGKLRSGQVRVDPAIAQVLGFYPEPNAEVFGDTGWFVFSNPVRGLQDFALGRLDHENQPGRHWFARYSLDRGSIQDQTNFALGERHNRTRTQLAALEYTDARRPEFIHEARLGLLRLFLVNGRTHTRNQATDVSQLAFLPGAEALGLVSVAGLSDLPGGSGALDSDRHAFTSYQLYYNATRMTRQHLLQWGGRLEHTRFDTDSQTLPKGEYRFDSIADFLQNRPSRFRAQLPGSDTTRSFRQWVGAVYWQDRWQLSSRLSVHVGLRYEPASVPTETHGRLANLDTLDSPSLRTTGPLFDNPAWKNFAPRLGLAIRPSASRDLVIRASYGIFFDLLLTQHLLIAGVRNPPFYRLGSTRQVGLGDFPQNGYRIFVQNPSVELRAERLAPDPGQPYVQQWTLQVEHALPSHLLARIVYSGSRGVHLSNLTEDANLAIPIRLPDGRRFFPEDGKKRNPHFSMIRNRSFDAFSSYHAVYGELERRWRDGVQFRTSYRYSKSLDDCSQFFASTEASNPASLPVNDDPHFNRGRSSHDVRHQWVLAARVDLARVGGRWGRMLTGWRLSTIATYSSGLPFSAWLGYDGARTRADRTDYRSGQRPDLAPGVKRWPTTGNPMGWVDPEAFRRPSPGFLGNLGRNTLPGPDLFSFDASLSRSFEVSRIREEAKLEVRLEAFNLFNRTNFDLPSPSRMEIFSPQGRREDVGRITSAAPGRQVQLGLRLMF